MLDLFSKLDNTDLTVVYDNNLDNIKDRFNLEISKIRDYYRYRDGKVSNNNMLVRLITTCMINYNRDIFEYVHMLDNDLLHYTKTFNIVSQVSKGSVLENVIFHKNSLELFIYEEADINLITIDDLWRDLRPIKILKYDDTDTSLRIPNNKISFSTPTLSIFKIDIKKLLIQYRYWALERLYKDFSTDPAAFLYEMVFPTLIYDILDFSILNRIRKINEHLIMEPNINKHPFLIFDLNDSIDRYIKNMLKYIKHENKTFTNIMKNIHLICSENMYELVFDNYLINSNNRYVYFLSKIPHIILLLEISNRETLKRNKDFINNLKIFIKKIERDRSMDNIDNELVKAEYEINMSILKQKLKEHA